MNKETSKLLPVLFGFFIMGFCDVVGIATSYVQKDFGLTETVAGFIPSMVFIWFLLLSIPAALLMNHVGRKNTVQISNVLTFIGMLLPFVDYNFYSCMAAFTLLGIGNTILQVSLNPLLANVVSGKSLTSALTAGQVVKAVSSFVGPLIAAFATAQLGNWMYIFPVYALTTLLSAAWLQCVRINETNDKTANASVAGTFSLLGNGKILLLFIGILAVVGTDVGMNTLAPKLLIERGHLPLEQAGLGSSVYFACRTFGAMLGTILLAKMSDIKYFRIHMLIALAALAVLYFVTGATPIFIFIGVVGYGCSSIFSVIYSNALKSQPDKANELSGLMITGVCGGAIVPPLMGWMSDLIGSQIGSLIVISIAVLYLGFCSFSLSHQTNKL